MTKEVYDGTTEENKDRFVAHVAGLDAGARAALRRSLAFPPGTWPGAFPYVERWVSKSSRWERVVTYLVAGLQANSRAERARGDLGEAARRLLQATESGSVESRFLALLDADAEQLPHRLRQMITLMSSQGIAPDWARLRRDLTRWTSPNRTVQQLWARSFYRLGDGDSDDGEREGQEPVQLHSSGDDEPEEE